MSRKTSTDADLTVIVERSESGKRSKFNVPLSGPMVVLDILRWIQEHGEATLAFRYSCRTGRCGTCAVLVNERPVLACQARVENYNTHIKIEPLPGFPVIRDLLVDMQVFQQKWQQVMPFLSEANSESAVLISNKSQGSRLSTPLRGCIKCGVCYSSYGLSHETRNFPGPAALNHVADLIADGGNRVSEQQLKNVLCEGGVDERHYQENSTGVCPRGLDPAPAINRLRRWRLLGKR